MNDKYWHFGKDCTKQTKIKPEVKLLVALKMILYGVLFGTFCDYFKMGESTVRQAVSKLAWGVLENQDITAKFLQSLTKSDAKKVFKIHNNQHGVLGMIVLIVCMFLGKFVPTHYVGNMLGKKEYQLWWLKQAVTTTLFLAS